MAVTKLWSRRAGGGHSSGSIIADTIDYACNEDKTKNLTYSMVDSEFFEDEDTVNNVLRYVVNDEKTVIKEGEFAELEEVLVSGINCQAEKADREFMQVKEFWNKTDKTLLWHGVQSFEPGEVDPSTAHEIGIKLAKKMWGDKFQVVVTTHCDRKHIHNHFVFNSVGFVDGKKYNYSNSEIHRLRFESDKLCQEYGLSVIEHPRGRGVNYNEYVDGNGGKTIRALIREDIDLAIANSSTLRDVFDYLEKELGYEVNTRGKYTTVHPPGSKRNFRLEGLDGRKSNSPKRYTEEAIVKRLLHKDRELVTQPAHKNYSPYTRYHTSVKNHCLNYGDLVDMMFRGTSVRATYWHYYYLLKNIGDKKTQYPKTHFQMRVEAQKKINRYSKHIQFFCRTGIKNENEIVSYFKLLSERTAQLEETRSDLRGSLRFVVSETEQNQIVNQISNLNHQIAQLRKERSICKEILDELPKIEEQLDQVNKEQNDINKERTTKWQQKM